MPRMSWSWREWLLGFTLMAGALLITGCSRDPDPRSVETLKRATAASQPPASIAKALVRGEWARIRGFYAARSHSPAWTSGRKLAGEFGQALDLLENAEADALDPNQYDLEWLSARRKHLEGRIVGRAMEQDDELVELELRTTAAVLRWARDLSFGRFDPTRRGEWVRPKLDLAPDDLVRTAADAGDLSSLPEQLRPTNKQYGALLQLWREQSALAAAGGWGQLRPSGVISPGARHPVIADLRQRLAVTGELGPAHRNGPVTLDDTLADALRAFQRRHGLSPTGAIDAPTRAALNVPAEGRLRQIEVNLERWRFLPRELGRTHIRVNIPDYQLALVDNDRVRLDMRVVVGEPESATPVLSDVTTHIVFSPYWNVPESIANDEMLPALMGDPDYLARNNIELVRVDGDTVEPLDPESVDWSEPLGQGLRFRQRPGSTNALGLVKFVLSNHLSIYLHDTPADGLFSRVSRALSHGCVRVERPVELAHALLAGPEWSPERVEQAMHQMEEQWVKLERAVPVHLLYFTVWVDEAGRAQFRPDIYGHDGTHARALAARARRGERRGEP